MTRMSSFGRPPSKFTTAFWCVMKGRRIYFSEFSAYERMSNIHPALHDLSTLKAFYVFYSLLYL